MLALLIMHGSILPTPLGIAIFFFFRGLFPIHRHAEGGNSPPDRPHICFLQHLFDPYKSKTTRFHNFYVPFPGFIDSTIMDVVKT